MIGFERHSNLLMAFKEFVLRVYYRQLDSVNAVAFHIRYGVEELTRIFLRAT